ncbi:MAG: Ca-activated chloride channel family protein [Planctomycetota bacterium]|jgi:Ca-activated chloride channel family protein
MNVWALQPPSWWPALLLLPAFLVFGHWLARRSYRQIRAELGRREHDLCGTRSFGRTRAALAGLAVVTIAFAMLRPVQPGREAQLAPDVVLCVDVSRSMAAGDGNPTRFAAMQQQVRNLLELGIGSRYALLAFAGDVQAIAPLTADREAIQWLLDELAPGAIASGAGGTNLGAAIDAAAERLERVGTQGDVLLLTDGEDFAGTAELAAAIACQNGHRVHCIGYGTTAGSKIVIDQGGEQVFLQDRTGQDVITRLDVDSLAAIAAAGSGTFRHDAKPSALVDLWRDTLVPYAAERQLAASDTDVVQRFTWPLLAGLLLMMLRMCLPERRR